MANVKNALGVSAQAGKFACSVEILFYYKEKSEKGYFLLLCVLRLTVVLKMHTSVLKI